MAERLGNSCFNGSGAPLDLPHKHCSLHGRDAEVRKRTFIGGLWYSTFYLLLDEERREFAPDDFKDEAKILADKLIVPCDLVANGAERAASGHAEAFLKFEVGPEPTFEVFPGFDVVLDRCGTGPDCLQVRL